MDFVAFIALLHVGPPHNSDASPVTRLRTRLTLPGQALPLASNDDEPAEPDSPPAPLPPAPPRPSIRSTQFPT